MFALTRTSRFSQLAFASSDGPSKSAAMYLPSCAENCRHHGSTGWFMELWPTSDFLARQVTPFNPAPRLHKSTFAFFDNHLRVEDTLTRVVELSYLRQFSHKTYGLWRIVG